MKDKLKVFLADFVGSSIPEGWWSTMVRTPTRRQAIEHPRSRMPSFATVWQDNARMQGHIEGSIDKLRRNARAKTKARAAGLKPVALGSDDDSSDEEAEAQEERILKKELADEPLESESALEEEQEENEEEEEEVVATIAAAPKRKRARKLNNKFDHVATLQDGEPKKQYKNACRYLLVSHDTT
uniref:Uncharacterized protein n=1 Tax=Oryza brachyantha TaxID=4533 RepID=J3KU54_ORYBR